MTGLKEGQRMRYQEDGRVFKITKITPAFVVLQALDNAAQILTGISSLDFLFEKLPPLTPERVDPSERRPASHFRREEQQKQQPDPALGPRV